MSKKIIAILLIMVMMVSVKANAAEYSVEKVENLISKIGNVTQENREAVVCAVEAYYQLDDAQKAKVSNFKTLEEAQQVLGLEDALEGLYIEYDEVNNTYFITAPVFLQSFSRGESCIMVSIYLHENQKEPGLVVSYVSMEDRYVNVNKLTIDIDGETVTYFKKDFSNVQMMTKEVKYNHTSKICEMLTKKVEKKDLEVLEKMIDAKEVNLTFWGETEKFFGEDVVKRSKYQLEPNIKWAIDEVLNAYRIYADASPEAREKALKASIQ